MGGGHPAGDGGGVRGGPHARSSGGHRADGRPHLRRAERQRQPARAGAASRGSRGGGQRGDPVVQPGRVRRDLRGLHPGGVPPHHRQLAPHARRGRLHRRRLPGARLRRRRGAARRRSRPRTRCEVRLAVGGDIDGFDRWDDVLAAEDGSRHRRPDARHRDALHVGHHRLPEGRQQGPRPRRARHGGVGALLHRRRRPPRHRTAVPHGSLRVRAAGVAHLRRHHRLHGRLGPRGDARAHRAAPGHPHPRRADDVPPAPRPARRREGSLRHLVDEGRAPRRRALSGHREAGDARLVGPGGLGVLRRHRGCRHRRRPDHVAAEAGHRRQGRSRPTSTSATRRAGPLPVGEEGLVWIKRHRRRPLRVLRRRRTRPTAPTEATTSPSATSAASTRTASSSSPTAPPTSSSPAA